ncbi:DEAD box ATP-dependent RNA helicase family member protein [Theileria equi strain WA]|uniref:ATP-dependent RNA helicase n=1 Tax=Theileria equi strain WA TaxID=1537102 RepID=L1LCL0_THEEQ|nr:DEAD box ATP-dependent RNA helicase family member protein [Theileria equi strain WA]EKX72985.1 DEAD box ATP-dependent RNA helicase family member protein [Theileria equi strain WA]|eukprot:XP_004832437.1 DEAD box ATP-dependent RNA helicase family member protein [Theileria equi strain WA]
MMRKLQLLRNGLCTREHELSLLLSRYVRSFPSNVKVWGSSVIQLNPVLDRNIVSRNKLLFRRRFKRCRIMLNGKPIYPNGFQLSTLRPQLGGSDLFIASPPNSGKTISYILPEVLKYRHGQLDCTEKQKILVLVPTLDLILRGTRIASGALKDVANVQPLYYKTLANNEDLSDISNANVIYSTPLSAYRLLLKQPVIFNNVRTLVIDEANRILHEKSSIFAVKIRNLLPENIQIIVLAPRNEDKLRQFASRFLRVNFRVISFCPEYKNVPITQHIPGPQRSGTPIPEDFEVHTLIPREKTELEERVEKNRLKVLDHCKIRQVYVDKDVKCEYILYKPIDFTTTLLSAILEHDKVIVIFPTVKMAQFCYIFFKHIMEIHCDTGKQFYALHGHLSLEKRRFVVDLFSSCQNGILFATDVVSVGLSFPHVEAVIQVGAARSVDVLSDRIGCSFYHESDKKSGYNLLLLHDLDTHILHEASQHNCDIKTRRADTLIYKCHKIDTKWVNSPSYLASCELMYRSLLGYYCNNADRLKFQRWQTPSLVNEIIKSFGCSNEFSVSKQFAARLHLLNAPGLAVKYDSIEKTQLQAAVLAYSGFRSRVLQGGISAKGFSKVAEMQIQSVPLKCNQEC